MLDNLILLPCRLLWNVIVIVSAVGLEIVWLCFIFGSVIGIVLLLIFMPDGFLLPLVLLNLAVDIWPDNA